MRLHIPHIKARWFAIASAVVICGMILVIVAQYYHNTRQSQLINSLQHNDQQLVDESEIAVAKWQAAESASADLAKQLENLKKSEDHRKYTTLDSIYTQFASVAAKVVRNHDVNLDTHSITDQYGNWGTKLLQQKYDDLGKEMSTATKQLDEQYSTYQKNQQAKAIARATPAPPVTQTSNNSQPDGYRHITVSTSRGSFDTHVIKLPLSAVTIKTLTANSSNCTNNCPAKSLSQYAAESGAYAAINGSYFCPPDYSWCAGKVNSYDFAVYNSNIGRWLNQAALSWNSEGLATFSGHSAKFYRYAKDFGGGSISAAIANFPPLLVHNSSVVITENQLDSGQKARGRRGVLGVDQSNVYLVVVQNASLIDTAYVMRSLGATEALNLDGGGSSALYIAGQYKVGPGRQLPNAIVLVK
jgi:exopolysaccharide biosynthesis protein